MAPTLCVSTLCREESGFLEVAGESKTRETLSKCSIRIRTLVWYTGPLPGGRNDSLLRELGETHTLHLSDLVV